MRFTRIAAAFALVVSLGACASGDFGNKQLAGSLIGAAGGGLLGSQFGDGAGQLAATAAGTAIGALVGNQIGQGLDRADQAAASRAQIQALETAPTGSTVVWRNPDSGNAGRVQPLGTYRTTSGEFCREFQHTVLVGGEAQDAFGTACRQPDGSWRISG